MTTAIAEEPLQAHLDDHGSVPERVQRLEGEVAELRHTLSDLAEIVESIGNELRNEYILGYSSTNNSRDGKYRRVQVNMASQDAPPLRVEHRKGYYAPAE